MKKIALLFTFAVAAFAANAQLTLTGTSYDQNFNSIGTALPTGWFLYTGATSSSLGTIDATYGSGSPAFGAYWDTLDCPSDVYGHGFKNCASADNGYTMSRATCIVQQAQTDRALGIRQASNTSYPGFDPGPSFALQLANTTDAHTFMLTFKLQSLDSSSPRVTTWTLDYGIGSAPTSFSPVTTTPATLTTGGSTFSNQTVTATLPSAIDNQSGPVWIRISTLTPTTGSGNRTTSAIDDFNLSWTVSGAGITNVSAPAALSLSVLGAPTSGNISFMCNTEEAGAYTLSIYDMTGRILHSQNVTAQSGNQVFSVNNLNLTPGMYIARLSNSGNTAVARIAIN